MKRPIYLDYQATTPCDPRVVDVMMPYLTEEFGNPHSRSHAYGWTAEEAVEKARHHIADLIKADPREVIFTSGATESNNLAIKGAAYFKGKGHIITLRTEHKCVLETIRFLEQDGFTTSYLPVTPSGVVDLEVLKQAITPETILVSIMAASNEIGIIQPLKEIGAICRHAGILFHTDAAQALGKIPLDVDDMNIDLMSLTSHKIYGPKGIGALYVRRKPRVRLRPLFHGGGQERGIRSGTLAPFLCVGFGEAARIYSQEMEQESFRLTQLRDRLLHILTTQLEAVTLNGGAENRLPGNLNLSFFGVEGEGLIMGLKDLAISSGSACTSASLEPSYVLKALGVTEDLIHTSLRISLGRFTTEEEVEIAGHRIVAAVNRLRDMSPLWDMYKEGVDLSTVEWIVH